MCLIQTGILCTSVFKKISLSYFIDLYIYPVCFKHDRGECPFRKIYTGNWQSNTFINGI